MYEMCMVDDEDTRHNLESAVKLAFHDADTDILASRCWCRGVVEFQLNRV